MFTFSFSSVFLFFIFYFLFFIIIFSLVQSTQRPVSRQRWLSSLLPPAEWSDAAGAPTNWAKGQMLRMTSAPRDDIVVTSLLFQMPGCPFLGMRVEAESVIPSSSGTFFPSFLIRRSFFHSFIYLLFSFCSSYVYKHWGHQPTLHILQPSHGRNPNSSICWYSYGKGKWWKRENIKRIIDRSSLAIISSNDNPGIDTHKLPNQTGLFRCWLAGRRAGLGLAGAGLMGGEGKANLRHPSSSSSPTIYSDRRRRMDSTTVETGLFCRMYLYFYSGIGVPLHRGWIHPSI